MLEDKTIIRQKTSRLEWWIQKIRAVISRKSREKINEAIRYELGDLDFSILCNNCLAGVFYHDAGKAFLSPTINLAFDGEDFIRFLENLDLCLSSQLHEKKTDLVDYPVAEINSGGGIEIRFVHYTDFKDCQDKWNRRKGRLDKTKLFVVATQRDGLNRRDLLERFNQLPYHKIMFTSHNYAEYDWAVCVPAFKGREQVGSMIQYANSRGIRYYETCFDIAGWIKDNSGPEFRN